MVQVLHTADITPATRLTNCVRVEGTVRQQINAINPKSYTSLCSLDIVDEHCNTAGLVEGFL